MPQATGSQSTLRAESEATFKTAVGSTSAANIPAVSYDIKSSKNLISSNTLTGRRDSTQPISGNVDVTGTIEMEMAEQSMGLFLKHTLGSLTPSGASDPFTHTGKVVALPTSFSLEIGYTDLAVPKFFLYTGCRIGKASFNFPSEGFPTAGFDIVGSRETITGATFASTPTSYVESKYSSFVATIEEGGSPIAVVESVRIDVDNDLDNSIYVIGGSGERGAIPDGFSIVTGELTALFEDTTLYDKAVAGTETSLKVTLTNSANRNIEFFIPEMLYEQQAPGVSGPKGIKITLPFTGFFNNSAENSIIQVTMINGHDGTTYA